MVCTTKHAQEIIERQAQTGKVVLVSYQRRYHRTYRFIRDLVQNNMLGQIQYISALQSQNWLAIRRVNGARIRLCPVVVNSMIPAVTYSTFYYG